LTCFSVEFAFGLDLPEEVKSPKDVIWVFTFFTRLMSSPLLESIEHFTPSLDFCLFLCGCFGGELALLYESIFASSSFRFLGFSDLVGAPGDLHCKNFSPSMKNYFPSILEREPPDAFTSNFCEFWDKSDRLMSFLSF